MSFWINLFADFRQNTVDVFHFTGPDVGDLIEAIIRVKGAKHPTNQFIDAIHIQTNNTTNIRRNLFSLIDNTRSDSRVGNSSF